MKIVAALAGGFALSSMTLISPGPALAQSVEEIVVTGMRATEWEPDQVPVVRLARRADNLIVEVRVVNDTRDAAGRRGEITETLRSMARMAATRPDIDLSIEDEGLLTPLTEDMVATLTLGMDSGRADTSVATLIVKTPIRADDTLDLASARIEAFVEAARKTGRSLADVSGDWELSIIDPTQYRTPVLALVAADAHATAAVFGDGYAVQIEGLAAPVTWRQSGPLELSLFIPYKMVVTPKP
jgi:hypothetical protein